MFHEPSGLSGLRGENFFICLLTRKFQDTSVTRSRTGAKPLPTEEGKYIEVLKRQDDGSWNIAYDIWNPNAPPAKK